MYKAGDTVKFSNISLHKYTVFCKQGAGYIVNIVVSNLSVFLSYIGEIIPLQITEKTSLWGQHRNLLGYLRLLLYTPLNAQSSLVTEVHESNGHGLVATYW